jgi:hypothetical protein
VGESGGLTSGGVRCPPVKLLERLEEKKVKYIIQNFFSFFRSKFLLFSFTISSLLNLSKFLPLFPPFYLRLKLKLMEEETDSASSSEEEGGESGGVTKWRLFAILPNESFKL